MNLRSRDIKLSIIDVGTNNILLLLAHKKRSRLEIIDRRSSISALGKNMKDHYLTLSGLRRTKNILNDFISFSRIYTDNILVVGTSCSREAKNINLLQEWLWQKHQLKYLIISGEQEAYFNGLANQSEFSELSSFILFDIGGGSTEFTLVDHQKIKLAISINLGIRRLQNEFGNDHSNKAAQTEKLLNNLKLPNHELPLIGIGGTVTSLAAIKHGLKEYNSNIVHKSKINLTEMKDIYTQIRRLNQKELATILPFDPKRSDIILTGTMIVQKILDYFQAEHFFISDRGFQFGILNLNNKELAELYEHAV